MITLTGVFEKDGSGELASPVGIPDKPITFSGTGVSDNLESEGANAGTSGQLLC